MSVVPWRVANGRNVDRVCNNSTRQQENPFKQAHMGVDIQSQHAEREDISALVVMRAGKSRPMSMSLVTYGQ